MADLTGLIPQQMYTFVTTNGRKYSGKFLSYGPDLIRVSVNGKPTTLFSINIKSVTPYSGMGGKYKSRSKRIKTRRRGGKSKHRRSVKSRKFRK